MYKTKQDAQEAREAKEAQEVQPTRCKEARKSQQEAREAYQPPTNIFPQTQERNAKRTHHQTFHQRRTDLYWKKVGPRDPKGDEDKKMPKDQEKKQKKKWRKKTNKMLLSKK